MDDDGEGRGLAPHAVVGRLEMEDVSSGAQLAVVGMVGIGRWSPCVFHTLHIILVQGRLHVKVVEVGKVDGERVLRVGQVDASALHDTDGRRVIRLFEHGLSVDEEVGDDRHAYR